MNNQRLLWVALITGVLNLFLLGSILLASARWLWAPNVKQSGSAQHSSQEVESDLAQTLNDLHTFLKSRDDQRWKALEDRLGKVEREVKSVSGESTPTVPRNRQPNSRNSLNHNDLPEDQK